MQKNFGTTLNLTLYHMNFYEQKEDKFSKQDYERVGEANVDKENSARVN